MSESVRAVERALDVLLCFNRQTPELSMTQIAEQIGIHKSTVHRLLATLERKRFVQRDPITGTYRLGIRLLQMAYLTLEQNDLRRIAAPFLHQLSDQTQETIHLAVLDDADVVFVQILESPQRVKLAASLGQRLPAFATASGKSMFAYMPENEVRRIIGRSLPAYTPYTPTSSDKIFEDLRSIRKLGYSISEQEYEPEVNAVASVVFDIGDQPVASVAVAGPAYRLTTQRLHEIGPLVNESARKITQELRLVSSTGVERTNGGMVTHLEE